MKRVLLIFSLLLVVSLQTAAQSYELKYDFKEGKTYLFREVTNNDLTQSMMGNEMKIHNSSNNVIRVTAEKKNDKGTWLNISLDSAYVTINMPMKDTAYSVNEMLNKRVGVLLSPEGEILERKDIDSADLEGAMIQLGKREALQFLRFISDKKVSTGESWIVNQVDTVNMMGGNTIMAAEMEFTIAGEEEREGYKVLKIPFKGRITIEGKGSMMGFDYVLEGSGVSAGDLYFAPKEGLPVHTEMSQDFDLTMAGTGSQNMIIPITQEVKTTRTLIK
jgi:hypothetical protein